MRNCITVKKRKKGYVVMHSCYWMHRSLVQLLYLCVYYVIDFIMDCNQHIGSYSWTVGCWSWKRLGSSVGCWSCFLQMLVLIAQLLLLLHLLVLGQQTVPLLFLLFDSYYLFPRIMQCFKNELKGFARCILSIYLDYVSYAYILIACLVLCY